LQASKEESEMDGTFRTEGTAARRTSISHTVLVGREAAGIICSKHDHASGNRPDYQRPRQS